MAAAQWFHTQAAALPPAQAHSLLRLGLGLRLRLGSGSGLDPASDLISLCTSERSATRVEGWRMLQAHVCSSGRADTALCSLLERALAHRNIREMDALEARACASLLTTALLAIHIHVHEEDIASRIEKLVARLQSTCAGILIGGAQAGATGVAVLFLLAIARIERAAVGEDAESALVAVLAETNQDIVRLQASEALAHCYGSKSPEMWNRLWLKTLATLASTLKIFDSNFEGVMEEPLLPLPSSSLKLGAITVLSMQCFAGACAVAVQMIRVGCSAGAVKLHENVTLNIVREVLALRVQTQVMSNPRDVSHVMAHKSDSLPAAALAAMQPSMQRHALELFIELLASPGLCSGSSSLVCRALNVCAPLIVNSAPNHPRMGTDVGMGVLQILSLEALRLTCFTMPYEVCTHGRPCLDALLLVFGRITAFCSDSTNTHSGKPEDSGGIDHNTCVAVLECLEALLLSASGLLDAVLRTQIEAQVCTLLSCLGKGVPASHHPDRRLRRQTTTISVLRAHPLLRLAVLKLAYTEAHSVQASGGIGANISLLAKAATTCIRDPCPEVCAQAYRCVSLCQSLAFPLSPPVRPRLFEAVQNHPTTDIRASIPQTAATAEIVGSTASDPSLAAVPVLGHTSLKRSLDFETPPNTKEELETKRRQITHEEEQNKGPEVDPPQLVFKSTLRPLVDPVALDDDDSDMEIPDINIEAPPDT